MIQVFWDVNVVSTGKKRRFEESKCRRLQRQAGLSYSSWTCWPWRRRHWYPSNRRFTVYHSTR